MKKNDYYQQPGRRTIDFLLGFLAAPFCESMLVLAWLLARNLIRRLIPITNGLFANLEVILGLSIAFMIPLYFLLFTRRKYIGLGIAVSYAVILVVFGGCFLMLRTWP